MDFTELFGQALSANGMEKYVSFAPKFTLLSQLVRETNDKFNITAITDEEGMAYRHFADCLYAEKYIPEGASVIDVGAGGGFPTLPLAIVRSDIKITSLDSNAKKTAFIDEAAKALDLSNVETVNMRAEEAGRSDMRERFDFVISRAVARMNILCEWCVPLLRVGGVFAALKGSAAKQEASEAENAAKALGCSLDLHEYDFYSPEKAERGIIFAYKRSKTDGKYPRNNSQIKKKPL